MDLLSTRRTLRVDVKEPWPICARVGTRGARLDMSAGGGLHATPVWRQAMVVLGLILLILGWLLDISILLWIGIVVLVIGVVLLILGALNRPVLGRRYWF
jgi:hypothetical protein